MTGIYQRSFVGGEVTDEVLTRSDTDRVPFSLATCRNFQVLRHGGVGNRAGTRYVGTSDATEGQLLLRTFQFNNQQAYCIEIGREAGGRNGFLRIIQDGAYLEPTSSGTYSSGTAYVPGDVVTGSDGFEYVAVADVPAASGYDPVTGGDFHWYLLENGPGGTGILELPIPYGANLADPDGARITTSQAGDSLVFTSTRDGNIQVYELTRLSADNWTFLPKAFKPGGTSTTISTAHAAPGSAHAHRYKLVVIDADGKLSIPAAASEGPYSGAVAGATLPSLPSYFSGSDIEVTHASHPFSDDDEIRITNVTLSTSPVYAFQNAIIALKDTTWKVRDTGTNTFELVGSNKLFNQDAYRLQGGDLEYRPFSISYDYAYWQRVTGSKTPDANHSFSWTAVDAAREYHVYHSTSGGPYYFLSSTTDTSYTWDTGDTDSTDLVLRDYTNPFPIDGSSPAASAFHQQRQVFAGNANRPDRVRGSRTGDIRDYTEDFVDPSDDDPYKHDIAPEIATPIYSMVSIGQLAVLFNDVIKIMSGDGDGAVTPSAPGVRTASVEGSANIQPLVVDDRLIYVESRQTYIRELAYNLTTGGFEGYVGRDLGIWAEHLFRGYKIVDWAYSRVPDATVWVVRSDGLLLGMTYIPEQQIWAWHRHDTGDDDAEFKTVAVVPEDNQDVLYLGVKREIDGSDVQYIERMVPRRSGREPNYDVRSDAVFLDSCLTYDGTNTDGATVLTLTLDTATTWVTTDPGTWTLTATSGTPFPGDASNVGNGYRLLDAAGNEVECLVTVDGSTTVQTVTLLTDCPAGLQATASTTGWIKMVDDISGLGHLEGETVGILADGNVLTQEAVSSGALAQFSRPYGIVHVGLPIVAQLEPLDLDRIPARGEGATADVWRSVNSVTLIMVNTRGAVAGRTETEQRPFELLAGEGAETLVTGKRLVKFNSSPDRRGRCVIQQLTPLPCALSGIIRNVSKVGGRG